MNLVTLIVLIVILLAILPTWPYSKGWGYYPSGGVGILVVILIVLLLTRAGP
jgi:low affinity Fe/Cu permease